MTMEQMLTAAVISICAALVYVYKRGEDKSEARHIDLKSRVDDCEKDRASLREGQVKLWEQMAKLMGGPRTDP